MIVSHRERAYAHIRKRLLLGHFPAGTRLSEVDLAKQIGISRTPVREALNQLSTEGLLEQVPRFGAFIPELSRDDVQELYELREMLEGYAAERAAARITTEQLAELQRLCDQFHQMCGELRDLKGTELPPDRHQQWVLCDVEFHLIVLTASASPRTRKMVGDLKLLSNLCGRRWLVSNPQSYRVYVRTWCSHLRVLRALRRRDGQAARQWMVNHIRRAKEGVLQHHDEWRANEGADADSIQRLIGRMESAPKETRR